jgi:hypothetical protein
VGSLSDAYMRGEQMALQQEQHDAELQDRELRRRALLQQMVRDQANVNPADIETALDMDNPKWSQSMARIAKVAPQLVATVSGHASERLRWRQAAAEKMADREAQKIPGEVANRGYAAATGQLPRGQQPFDENQSVDTGFVQAVTSAGAATHRDETNTPDRMLSVEEQRAANATAGFPDAEVFGPMPKSTYEAALRAKTKGTGSASGAKSKALEMSRNELAKKGMRNDLANQYLHNDYGSFFEPDGTLKKGDPTEKLGEGSFGLTNAQVVERLGAVADYTLYRHYVDGLTPEEARWEAGQLLELNPGKKKRGPGKDIIATWKIAEVPKPGADASTQTPGEVEQPPNQQKLPSDLDDARRSKLDEIIAKSGNDLTKIAAEIRQTPGFKYDETALAYIYYKIGYQAP